jgi:hypothetical protein
MLDFVIGPLSTDGEASAVVLELFDWVPELLLLEKRALPPHNPHPQR